VCWPSRRPSFTESCSRQAPGTSVRATPPIFHDGFLPPISPSPPLRVRPGHFRFRRFLPHHCPYRFFPYFLPPRLFPGAPVEVLSTSFPLLYRKLLGFPCGRARGEVHPGSFGCFPGPALSLPAPWACPVCAIRRPPLPSFFRTLRPSVVLNIFSRLLLFFPPSL